LPARRVAGWNNRTRDLPTDGDFAHPIGRKQLVDFIYSLQIAQSDTHNGNRAQGREPVPITRNHREIVGGEEFQFGASFCAPSRYDIQKGEGSA
jgi:hypothetical protein